MNRPDTQGVAVPLDVLEFLIELQEHTNSVLSRMGRLLAMRMTYDGLVDFDRAHCFAAEVYSQEDDLRGFRVYVEGARSHAPHFAADVARQLKDLGAGAVEVKLEW